MDSRYFQREVKDRWKVSYEEMTFPAVQKGWILPPDPERSKEFDPFILLAEDWFKRGAFSDHPHRGFQTVTYVIDGRLEHIDNKGGQGILEAGDVQYMNAGSGARHAEEAVEDDIAHTLQLWLNLPDHLRSTTPSYQDVLSEDCPIVPFDGGLIKVYAGELHGVVGTMMPLVPFTLTELSFNQTGSSLSFQLPATHNAFLYVLSGEVKVGKEEESLLKSDVALLSYKNKEENGELSEIFIQSNGRSKVLIYSGEPIKEDYVAGGPFIGKTREDIQKAYREYHEGKFGPKAK
ncbi:pirin family protein [Evansella sp. AB-P1]|uniref:pirin family protein n=1 Tax=Evansella sp. AB-P1 TaxID=3037653 RepID=UPI00241FFDFB|nr:pirin family protein [Evansella sp. AB-P1]MDG5788955.1 pirin family protein [Evansella sp. AB-P1]